MTMRPVKKIVFREAGNMLFGRRISSTRAVDGYVMSVWPESGVVTILDPKEGEEVLVHLSRCDVYIDLDREKPSDAPATKPVARPQPGAGAPQVK